MNAPREVFLQPGDWHFGGPDLILRTLLGSCISITLWHPQRRIGGMCHFLLPQRCGPRDATLDGRYGAEAVASLCTTIRQNHSKNSEYQCKIFGGGNMLHSQPPRPGVEEPCADVSCRNVRAAVQLVRDAGFTLHALHAGGRGHRNLSFDLNSGEVLLRFSGTDAQIWRRAP
ncbi:chemotaxis protein CheD [Acidithiobacillus sp. IBUN Pt1247-S3]|uniref:chemotaxis protein CheD n=1 Tax=Acidithiobacillus sp. IBUN Pt1247-S3 TaxID=3166642 RepID=UPI0034E4F68D